MNFVEILTQRGYALKRKAACHGGEYSSSCPFCKDGVDRFVIWPNKSNNRGEFRGGYFLCRVCQKTGDAITFLRAMYGTSFIDACAQLGVEPKLGQKTFLKQQQRLLLSSPLPLSEKSSKSPSSQSLESSSSTRVAITDDPPASWQEKGQSFIQWAHEQLIHDPVAIEYLQQRGFTLKSIRRYKLGFNPKSLMRNRDDWGLERQYKDNGKPKSIWLPTGIVIPTFSADGNLLKLKIRRSEWTVGDNLPKYVEVSGSKQTLSVFGDTALGSVVILESELDALLLQQFAADLVYCIALGGSTKPIDQETDSLLQNTDHLYFCPDFDKAGAIAWVKWRKMYPSLICILSSKEKSLGDAHTAGEDLRKWIKTVIAGNAPETEDTNAEEGIVPESNQT